MNTPHLNDPLTGLPRREAFLELVAAAIDEDRGRARPVALAIVDIDLFGAVNAELGRETGDALIRHVAQALCDGARDSGGVFRYGGDAFSVALPGVTKEQAFLRLEQIRKTFEETGAPDGRAPRTTATATVSVGVSAFPDDGDDPYVLANKANEALYRAKVSGRNQVCLAREEKMITKTSHYTAGQLMGLRRLAERMRVKDAELLREALNDLLLKHNA